MWKRRRPRPSIDFPSQLQAIPIRNEKARIVEQNDERNDLVVEVQLRFKGMNKFWADWCKVRRTKQCRLEGVSREIFDRIDGKTSVEQLIDHLADAHNLQFLEARALIVQYLSSLMSKGLIVVVGKQDQGQ